MRIIASPVGFIEAGRSKDETIKRLKEKIELLAKERNTQIEEIVVGMPYKMNKEDSKMTLEVKAFVEALKGALEIPITIWDERLTTKIAERSLKEGGRTRKQRVKEVDTVAACLVLQNYLDMKRVEE